VSALDGQHARTLSYRRLWVRVPKCSLLLSPKAEGPGQYTLIADDSLPGNVNSNGPATCSLTRLPSREKQPETACAVLTHPTLGTRTQTLTAALTKGRRAWPIYSDRRRFTAWERELKRPGDVLAHQTSLSGEAAGDCLCCAHSSNFGYAYPNVFHCSPQNLVLCKRLLLRSSTHEPSFTICFGYAYPNSFPWERCRNLHLALGRSSQRLFVLRSAIRLWVRVPKQLPLLSSESRSLQASALEKQHTRALFYHMLWVRVPKQLPLGALPEFASCSREKQPETVCAALSHPALGTRTQTSSTALLRISFSTSVCSW
jgi:hypothetical protein